MTMKYIPLILGLIVSITLSNGCRQKAEETHPLTATAARGPLVISIQGSGDIRAMNAVKISPEIKRPSAISSLIPDGSLVKSNDVIALFNTDDIDQRIKDLEVALSEAETKLVSAKTGLDIQLMDNKSFLTIAEQGVASSTLELQKFLKGDEPMDRRNAEVKAKTAESEYMRKKRGYEELQGLLKDGFVTEDEIDEERVKLETTKLSMETAIIEKKLLEDYTIPLNNAAAEAALAKAKTELEKARKQTEAFLLAKTQAVESSQPERQNGGTTRLRGPRPPRRHHHVW